MKKILSVIAILSIFCGIEVCANVSAPNLSGVSTEQELSKNLSSEITKLMSPEDLAKSFMSGYFSYLRECKPYDVNFGFNVIDFGMQSQLKVDGWVNERCVYNISGRVTHISDNLRSMFNITIPDSELSKIEPILQCKLTKAQLNKIIDTLEEEAMKEVNKDVYAPANKDLEKKQESIFVEVLSAPNTCNVLNSEDITKLFLSK